MYAGQVVETGRVEAVFAPAASLHRALLAGVPEGEAALAAIPGVVPQPHAFPAGCPFAPRCPHAAEPRLPALPALADAEAGHMRRCIRWREVVA